MKNVFPDIPCTECIKVLSGTLYLVVDQHAHDPGSVLLGTLYTQEAAAREARDPGEVVIELRIANAAAPTTIKG